MNIIRRLTVPTGDILIVDGEFGKLEMLSLADYGQDVNLNQNKTVLDDTPLMPLSKKWVITVSTQYGCSMGCEFCDVPRVGAGRNATFNDLRCQILTGLQLHPEVTKTQRLNIHFARMGEPTWNSAVLDCGRWIHDNINPDYPCHPVVSTMMPRNNRMLKPFIRSWMALKNDMYGGNAGLQLSINSTSEEERRKMFSNNACSLAEIQEIMSGVVPVGRKITLNFAICGYEVNPDVLLKHFSPEWYVVKLTPMHKTETAMSHSIKTTGEYTSPAPYESIANNLRSVGYDVLVFIASHDEDASRITCGNAILSGALPHKYTESL